MAMDLHVGFERDKLERCGQCPFGRGEFDFEGVVADAVVVAPLYSAGEAPIDGATGAALAAAVGTPHFVARVADMPAALAALTRDGDVVIGMGAGSMSGLPRLVADHFSQGASA